MRVEDADAAFILGKGGKTKHKLALVSNCKIDLVERDLIIEMTGTELQRTRARRFIKCVMAQRNGKVYVDDTEDDDKVLTLLDVPESAVGFVTGRMGNFLRTIESEWNVLMLFGDYGDRKKPRDCETLHIFGDLRARRGAELKIMSAAECKVPGYYSDAIRDMNPEDLISNEEGFATDYVKLRPEKISYALGPKGGTRRKVALASQCIVEYVGEIAHFSGIKEERCRGRQYLQWLFDQLDGPVTLDWKSQKHLTAIDIPNDCVGYVTGARRSALGTVEQEWGVLMFFLDTRMKRDAVSESGTEKLLIFGPTRNRTAARLKVMSSVENKARGYFTKSIEERRSKATGFGVDRFILKDEDISYALGREGATRYKLEKASNCILQYIGNLVYMAGTKKERSRCYEYLNWLLDQRRGSVTIANTKERDDCNEVHIPQDCIGYLCGNRGEVLRNIERRTGTFCFMALDDRGEDRLVVFSHNPGDRSEAMGRYSAEMMVNDAVNGRLRDHDRGRYRSRSRGRGGGGGYGRGRSPSYDRRRRRTPSYDRRRRSPSYDRRRRSPSYDRRRSPSRRRSSSYDRRRY